MFGVVEAVKQSGICWTHRVESWHASSSPVDPDRLMPARRSPADPRPQKNRNPRGLQCDLSKVNTILPRKVLCRVANSRTRLESDGEKYQLRTDVAMVLVRGGRGISVHQYLGLTLVQIQYWIR